mgnify:CR=1 FL=1|jgi:hypothetical protein
MRSCCPPPREGTEAPDTTETYSSTPTHFPAANLALLPVHLTNPTPAETETFAPKGTSVDVIVLCACGS